MKSIRWIQKIIVDGEPGSIEVMMGVRSIADRCYVRWNQEPELWYAPISSNRSDVIQQGLDLIRKQLAGHEVLTAEGSPYQWMAP